MGKEKNRIHVEREELKRILQENPLENGNVRYLEGKKEKSSLIRKQPFTPEGCEQLFDSSRFEGGVGRIIELGSHRYLAVEGTATNAGPYMEMDCFSLQLRGEFVKSGQIREEGVRIYFRPEIPKSSLGLDVYILLETLHLIRTDPIKEPTFTEVNYFDYKPLNTEALLEIASDIERNHQSIVRKICPEIVGNQKGLVGAFITQKEIEKYYDAHKIGRYIVRPELAFLDNLSN